jgi:hypothetical protein
MSRGSKPTPGGDVAAAQTIADFLGSLDDLNDVQLLGIYAAWQARDERAHEDAWTEVIATAAKEGLTVEVEHARDAALGWAMRGTNLPMPYTVWAQDALLPLRRQVGPALADAAVVMVLGSRLDEATGETLIGPWMRSVTGADEPA